jgi:hypothetical protein
MINDELNWRKGGRGRCGLIEGKIPELYQRERTTELLRRGSKQQFPITNDSPYAYRNAARQASIRMFQRSFKVKKL